MKAIDLVDYIIYFSEKIKKPVTNLRLNVLLCFIQKESMMRNHQPAFDDEIRVLKGGIIVPSIYYSFSHYANIPIISVVEKINIIDKDIQKIIDNVLIRYQYKKTYQLVDEIRIDSFFKNKMISLS